MHGNRGVPSLSSFPDEADLSNFPTLKSALVEQETTTLFGVRIRDGGGREGRGGKEREGIKVGEMTYRLSGSGG